MYPTRHFLSRGAPRKGTNREKSQRTLDILQLNLKFNVITIKTNIFEHKNIVVELQNNKSDEQYIGYEEDTLCKLVHF